MERYLVKYAVMPIEEQIGWTHGLHELEPEYEVVANIVSKCYVIGEVKKYFSSGTYQTKYEVVFPFVKKDNNFDFYRRLVPEYGFNKCINSITVNQVFDNFEEALNEAKQDNKRILDYKIETLRKSDVARFKEKNRKTLNKYKEIEKIIEEKTADMRVIKASSLEDVIEKILENPSKFYEEVSDILSVDEREYLKSLINNRSCSNCTNMCCRVPSCEKVGSDEFGNPEGSNCLGWENPELIGKQKILKKTARF